MKLKAFVVSSFLVLAAVLAASAAQALTVLNHSFEQLPGGGLPFGGCGTGCSYSDGAIPGWSITGQGGQFQPGVGSGNFSYFNSLPDGPTVAYSNGGTIWQTVAETAQAGATYTLLAERGNRKDLANPNSIALYIGAHAIFATGIAPTEGNWATYAVVYTVAVGEAGLPIKIALSALGAQGDWDNVRLTATPLPGALPLFATGLGIASLVRWRRKRKFA